MSIDKFLHRANEILDSQSGENAGDASRGYRLVRASEIGIMFKPGSPAHVTEPRILKMPTNTPAGFALWEQEAQAVQASIQNISSEAPTQTKSTEPFYSTKLSN